MPKKLASRENRSRPVLSFRLVLNYSISSNDMKFTEDFKKNCEELNIKPSQQMRELFLKNLEVENEDELSEKLSLRSEAIENINAENGVNSRRNLSQIARILQQEWLDSLKQKDEEDNNN